MYRDCQKKFKCLLVEAEHDNEQQLIKSDEMQEITQPNKTTDEPLLRLQACSRGK